MKLLLVMALLGVGVNEVWGDDLSTTIYSNTGNSTTGWSGTVKAKSGDSEGWASDETALQVYPLNKKSAYLPITSDMLSAPMATSTWRTSYKVSFYFKPKAKYAFQMAVYSNKASVDNNGTILSNNYLAEVTVSTAGDTDDATVEYKINGVDVDGQTLTQEYYHFEVTVTGTTASFSLTTADGLTNKGSGTVTLGADETLGGIYFAGGDTRIDDITYSYQYSATATTTATLTSMAGSGKTMYPVYMLASSYTNESGAVESPTYVLSDETKATIVGNTLTFTANCSDGLTIKENTTGALITLFCYGPYERTINQSFAPEVRGDVVVGVKTVYDGSSSSGHTAYRTPTGFISETEGSEIVAWGTTFKPGGGDSSYPQYYKSLGFDASKVSGTSTTLKMYYYKNYGLQIADQDFYLRLLSPLKGQILKISNYKGTATPSQKLSEASLNYSYEFVTTPGGDYNTHVYTIPKENYVVLNTVEVYTPVTYTAVPSSIATIKIGDQSNNADLSSIILTKDNVSGISDLIAAGAYTSIYLSPQTASDIIVEDIQSLVPTANKNSWWINMPQKNYYNRPLTYWMYQKGINVRAYAGSSTWNTYGYALTDGVDYTSTGAVTPSKNCTYDRVFTKDIVSTICLPFAIAEETAATLGKFYQLKNTTTTDNVVFEEVTATEALKPYLFIPAATGTITIPSGTTFVAAGDVTTQTEGGVTFNGSIASSTISSTIYGFASSGNLVTANSGTMNPFRAYLTTTPGARLSLYSLENETTGISGVNAESKTLRFYNLQGQSVKAPAKGLYIVNGKKVIIK